ncbi:MAG: bifunctional DNA-formamidopyrimidine glycosylase/DNA-(apurinic or apyrimidinic site) lyase [Pseudomonadota bacterium]|nr:bifunctional DNA-formamidopyrimidine glycosylase/DNA-(apurinic or apyrimidinic site) lyase [Pseudomonadota bacterium]
MPELPEVETTRCGIEPHLCGQKIQQLIVRQPRLRWPVPGQLARRIKHARIRQLSRRGKYLLIGTDTGTLIIHLGMSGSLCVIKDDAPPGRHDHIDLLLENGTRLRFRDPRRFGAWLWTDEPPETHPLLNRLGPEPLSSAFNADYFHRLSRGRKLAIKSLLMDSHALAGVGNIYANEALFLAGIHPARAAGRISQQRYVKLVAALKRVLNEAIRQGGTTLRDFTSGEGKPGYFQQSLCVYAQQGKPCPICTTPIRETRTAQRSTFYCPHCQR